jgi:CheY-specific phosphatase CheX
MAVFPAEIRDILVSAVCGIFTANCVAKAEEKHDGVTRLDHCDFCAIIGFSGVKIKGTLLLAATKELLDYSHPSKAMGMDVGEEDYADWIGEISNQVVGRLKNSLLKFGVNAALTTPTVIKGEGINSYNLKGDSVKESLHFQLDQFDLLLEAHVTLLEPIDFSVTEADKKTEDEGSSLFF